ncbi:MAG: VWA domain-containing protein [Treponema sp.]|nr:VWA domain-containing protein [Treponema sp.]MCL2237418.1 VWA domain-containing protein [Treponema sp.]
MSFSFDDPFIAFFTLILVPVGALVYHRLKNPFVAAIPLGAPGGVPFKTSQVSGLVRLLKFLEVTGIFLLCFSAAGPAIKISEMVFLNRGADIIFIFDVSPSMAALDMDGKSRFTVGRDLIRSFANNRPSDSIGLVAVGEDAALLVPPTADRNALEHRLEQLQPGELGDGTALGMGISVAAFHLDKSNAKRKVAVLITDGENNAGAIHPETAAGLIHEIGVSFWVIAAGSAGEVPIDYTDPNTKIRLTGIFDSRYDVDSLRRLALSGNGTFIYAPNIETFSSAFSQLDDGEITIQRTRIINRRHSLSFEFLLISVILLVTVKFVRRKILGAIL